MSSTSGTGQTTTRAGLVADLEILLDADIATCDRDTLDALVARSQRLRGFLDAFDVRVAARAAELADEGSAESPGEVLRNRGRRSRKDAERATRRSRTCDLVPGLGDALAEGRVSGDHVDAIGDAAGSLDDDGQAKLTELAGELVDSAERLPVERFRRETRQLARNLSRNRGESHQQRLRRQRKVSHWLDPQTGLWKTLLDLDPETDARMWAAINDAVSEARADQQPGDDRSFDHVQVDTIVDLICGSQGVDPRVPEVVVHIDLHTLLGGHRDDSTCETSGGEPVDVDAVRRLGCDGDLVGVLFDEFGHVLDVGRTCRLATRAQRQALRAMYRTCGFPSCEVSVDLCRIHHVTWWERGGVTDLNNLIPLCSVHHHLVHEGGWTLTIDPDRIVTVHRADGVEHFRGDTTNRVTAREQTPPSANGTRPNRRGRVDDLAAEIDAALAAVRARHARHTSAERSPP